MRLIFNYQLLFFKKKGQRGFTLVELLVYMGIFSIMLVVVAVIFGAILDVHLESQSTSALAQDGNYIVSRLVYDIQKNKRVISPAAAGTSSTISLQLGDTDGTVRDTYVWDNSDPANKVLKLTDNGSTDVLNSVYTSVDSITFTNVGNDSSTGIHNSVEIIVTLKSRIVRSGNNINQETFETTVQTGE